MTKMKNMTATAIKGQAAQPFQVGDIVQNFGAIVRIESIDAERGLLVRIIPWQRWIDGRWVQQGGVGQRYFANPAKCAPRTAATVGWPSTADLNGEVEVEAEDAPLSCSFCGGGSPDCGICCD